jgi:pyruvate,water dikinase
MPATSNTHESRDHREPLGRYVLDFHDIDQTRISLVGGKGAHLGELSRIDGIGVPGGFCVTTDAFRRALSEVPSADGLLERLSHLRPDDHDAIRALSAELRRSIERCALPNDVVSAITRALEIRGERVGYAVRSSATAEDSPTTSFAGQHDTYLNVAGTRAILEHIGRCWGSLFTERAVTYRLRNGVDHRSVRMAVVVQQMVVPQASGVLFTADPVTGNRKVASVDATFGLGEALVSGLVNPDVYKVREGAIVERTIATKRLAIEASADGGGTREAAIEPERQQQPALTDAQVVRLAQLGRRIEAHFGRPQDIEWCLVNEDFVIVQSRPITTLFPVPVVADGENHVYLSTGHQQMMTDALKPLGISVWRLPGAVVFHEAGGRLFVDASRMLATASGRAGLLGMAGKSDPLTGDALRTIIERGFIPSLPDPAPGQAAPGGAAPAPLETDPAVVADLIAGWRASNAELARELETKRGPALLDCILADSRELKRVLFDPRTHQAIMASVEATWWLNDNLEKWLGEKNAAAVLSQSVPNNVTSEMGLELLHVADVSRPHPAVVELLSRAGDDDFLNALPALPGGEEAREAIQGWLDKYGMRGVGEIDITRPRWSERPSMLVPLILSNVRNFEPGAGKRRFEEGLRTAKRKEDEVLARLRALPDGEQKAREAKAMIDRLRTFAGYREYPKYFIVSRYFAYKLALLAEADRLVAAHVLGDREDIFYLTLQELRDVVGTREVDHDLIWERKEAFHAYRALTPPRVLTSEGEMLNGAYRRGDLPPGALVGLAVSAGTVEGRARVIFDPADADIEPDDILVTRYTDPSWTPVFVGIRGLVTEVGGLMTHGSVIAREYGLPAVVGVEQATRLIPDGQRIRVHGTDGYVELLS